MDKMKRNERIAMISHILTESPNRIFTLNHFCQMFGAAKSTISEDIDIIRTCFANFSTGEIETVAGASGGVRYLPYPICGGKEFVSGICDILHQPDRVLPGGYLYVSDILSNPDKVNKMGKLLASQFYKQAPDFVLTVETKGISLAMATADALGISCVIARRGQQNGMEWPYLSINYISGSNKLQTMSVTKKLVSEGQRALIIDDYMKAGGTAKAMMEMMREFSITVVGIGMMLTRETEAKKQVNDVKSLMIVKDINEDTGAQVVPAPWLE